eukprot:scaffold136979_cov20-Cyclotella_meneghiniana.AAC.1
MTLHQLRVRPWTKTASLLATTKHHCKVKTMALTTHSRQPVLHPSPTCRVSVSNLDASNSTVNASTVEMSATINADVKTVEIWRKTARSDWQRWPRC